MIVKLLFELVINLLEFVFGWVSFPQMPEVVTSSLEVVVGVMADAMGFVWLIIPRELVIAVLPVILVVENFDKLYSIVMWILKKIPFLGMK